MDKLIISVKGMLDDVFSKGMETGAVRVAKENGWNVKVYTYRSLRHILAYLEKHQPDHLIMCGHSMGANTIDNAAERYDGPKDVVFTVASAKRETLPKDVKRVFWVTGDRDWRQFTINGGGSVERVKLPESHTSIDDSELLWELVSNEMKRLDQKKGVPMPTRPFYMGSYAPLTDSDYRDVARQYGLQEAHIRAIVEIESSGQGSHTSGALVCLYEPHVAWRNTSGETRAALARAGLAYANWKRGQYPRYSFERIDRCVEIVAGVRRDYEAGVTIAALATSWGLGQILGENYRLAGFESAGAMVREFSKGEREQLVGMMEFIESKGILDDLRELRWVPFAEGYNGARQADHNYSGRLSQAYEKWAAKTSPIDDKPPVVIPPDLPPVPIPDNPPAIFDGITDQELQSSLGVLIRILTNIQKMQAENLPTDEPAIEHEPLMELPAGEQVHELRGTIEMDKVKKWWQSKGVNGGIVSLISIIAMISGYDVGIEQATELGNKFVELIGAAGALIAIVGRWKADARIA